MRARKICSAAQCFNLQPCPDPDHAKKPWEGSRRSDLAKVKGRTASNRRKRILLKYDTISSQMGRLLDQESTTALERTIERLSRALVEAEHGDTSLTVTPPA